MTPAFKTVAARIGSTEFLEMCIRDRSGGGTVSTPAPNTAELTGLKITIDPGHQAKAPSGTEQSAPWSDEEKRKNTAGTAGKKTGIDEYLVNLQIALKLRDALTAKGATVVMTRDNHDTSLSNQDRAAISNNNNVDVIVSVHNKMCIRDRA